jgi:hypothetical protein
MGMVCLRRRGISGDNKIVPERILSFGVQRFVALSISLIPSSYNGLKAFMIATRGFLLFTKIEQVLLMRRIYHKREIWK